MEIRGYRLRIDRKEMMRRYKYLCGSTTHILPNGGLPTTNEKEGMPPSNTFSPSGESETHFDGETSVEDELLNKCGERGELDEVMLRVDLTFNPDPTMDQHYFGHNTDSALHAGSPRSLSQVSTKE